MLVLYPCTQKGKKPPSSSLEKKLICKLYLPVRDRAIIFLVIGSIILSSFTIFSTIVLLFCLIGSITNGSYYNPLLRNYEPETSIFPSSSIRLCFLNESESLSCRSFLSHLIVNDFLHGFLLSSLPLFLKFSVIEYF